MEHVTIVTIVEMRRVVSIVDGYPKVGHEVILSSGEIISLLIGGGYTCCETIGTELILPGKYTDGDLADEQEILGTVVTVGNEQRDPRSRRRAC